MHVFVSHSRINRNPVFRVSDELRKRNIETWLDLRDLWRGVGSSGNFGNPDGGWFCVPDRAPGPGDRWQTFEWRQVVNQEFYLDPSKPLIPILIGDPEIPGFLKTRQFPVLGDAPGACEHVADKIVSALKNPESSIDPEKLRLGREARRQALESFREYSQVLETEDIKRAGLRAVE